MSGRPPDSRPPDEGLPVPEVVPALLDRPVDVVFRLTVGTHGRRGRRREDALPHLPLEELKTRYLRAFYPGDSAARVLAALGALRAGSRVEVVHHAATDRAGQAHHLETRLVAMEDGSVLAIVSDITERKLFERGVLDAAERERRRLAGELHDELGQQLTGAAFLVKSLEEKLLNRGAPEAEVAQQVAELLERVLRFNRGLVQVLAPVTAGPGALEDALRELAEYTTRVFGVPCRFEPKRAVPVADENVSFHLYRIAQEAVLNAIRHAGPRTIDIALVRSGTRVQLVICDDGRGIGDAAIERGGFGLHFMRWRADLISASLEIGRGSPTGTVVECVVEVR